MWYWHKDKLIKRPETKPHTYGQMIFDKSAKAIQQGKDIFSEIVLGKLDIHLDENIGENHDIGFGNDFFFYDDKGRGKNKQKSDKLAS